MSAAPATSWSTTTTGRSTACPACSTRATDRPAATDDNAENFLIVGSDSRGDLAAGEGVQGTGDTFVSGQRADTVILAHLYGGRSKQAQLISFPRDSYVDIPTFTDPDTGKTSRRTRASSTPRSSRAVRAC